MLAKPLVVPTKSLALPLARRKSASCFCAPRIRRKDGKEHRAWSVVENRRVHDGRVVQRQVLYLGEINDSQRAAWSKAIEVFDEGTGQSKQIALFPEDRLAPALDCDVVSKHGNKKHAGWGNTVLGWIEIDGTRLNAEVNSEARADAIRKKIETALGEGIRYRASEIQSPERMLADLRAAGGARGGAASEEYERLAERPEVREKISELMAAHWEHWVDEPLPILGNRTPMDAVKDPDGREIVESLVIQGERFGRNPTSSTDENVFQRLRERLGLAGSQNQSTRGSSTRS